MNGCSDDFADSLISETADFIDKNGLLAIFQDPVSFGETRVELLPGFVSGMAVAGCISYFLDSIGACKPEMCHRSGTPHALVFVGKNTYQVCCPIMLGDVLGVKQRKFKGFEP